MNKLFAALLVLTIASLVIAWMRRKRTISGTIVGKRIAPDYAMITIKIAEGERFRLVFDTYPHNACKHFKLTGSSQCFHRTDPKDFEAMMADNKTITVSISRDYDEGNTIFVHRLISIV